MLANGMLQEYIISTGIYVKILIWGIIIAGQEVRKG
jgi:hypothetical protein